MKEFLGMKSNVCEGRKAGSIITTTREPRQKIKGLFFKVPKRKI
jgi:hypothetical protein